MSCSWNPQNRFCSERCDAPVEREGFNFKLCPCSFQTVLLREVKNPKESINQCMLFEHPCICLKRNPTKLIPHSQTFTKMPSPISAENFGSSEALRKFDQSAGFFPGSLYCEQLMCNLYLCGDFLLQSNSPTLPSLPSTIHKSGYHKSGHGTR